MRKTTLKFDLHSFDALESRTLLSAMPTSPAFPVVELATTYGSVFLELYTDTAPGTVNNFLGYVNRGDYNGTFFHRAVLDEIPGVTDGDFVIQGGAFRHDRNGTAFVPPNPTFPDGIFGYSAVETQPQIQNEFARSNLRWTVAMAKLGSGPNTATNQFFFNLSDNSGNLDNQNGGFTVFAGVIDGFDVIDQMARQRTINVDGGLFEQLLVTEAFPLSNPTDIRAEDLVTIFTARQVFTPGDGLVPSTQAPIGGSKNSFDQLTLGFASVGGGTVAIRQTGADTFSIVDVGLAASTPTTSGQTLSWFDANLAIPGGVGGTRIYAMTAQGLVQFTPTPTGDYAAVNLTSQIGAGAQPIASGMTLFQGTDGTLYIAGLAQAGGVLLYTGTSGAPNTAGEHLTWSFRNITQQDLAPNGLTTPGFVGSLTSYVTPWNGLNIAGLDSNGDIHTVWTAPSLAGWTTSNLSDITGAPTLTGGLSPYLTSWGGINLAGANQSGDLTTTWWVPGGQWSTFNLTASLDGPQLQAASTTTYVTSWNGLNIVGLDNNGEVVIYWWAPGQEAWTVTPLSQAIPGDTPPVGAITGITGVLGRTSIVGANSSNEVVRYTWAPGDVWRFENISTVATFG